eukprot:scaffold7815_cov248-Pinguiococcus_pyrenoidosus.AAC.5
MNEAAAREQDVRLQLLGSGREDDSTLPKSAQGGEEPFLKARGRIVGHVVEHEKPLEVRFCRGQGVRQALRDSLRGRRLFQVEKDAKGLDRFDVRGLKQLLGLSKEGPHEAVLFVLLEERPSNPLGAGRLADSRDAVYGEHRSRLAKHVQCQSHLVVTAYHVHAHTQVVPSPH